MSGALVGQVGAQFERIALSPPDSHRWFYLFEAMQTWREGGAADESLFDFLAAWIARAFHDRRMSYEDADTLANDLNKAIQYGYDPIFTEGMKRDALWWRIYLAFDAGEFHREPGEDPVSAYTRPQIAMLVEEIAALGVLASIRTSPLREGAVSLSEPAATFAADAARSLPRPPPPRRGPYRGRRGPDRG